MKAWCRNCQAERFIPFNPAPDERNCVACGSRLSSPPRERKPLERKNVPKDRMPPGVARPTFKGASPAQKAKIAESPMCIACRVEMTDYIRIDPAHLTPRSKGGCDSEDCVVGLCRLPGGRGCHRLFDSGELDLMVIIAERWPTERREVQHMLEHLSPVSAVSQLANARLHWTENAA